MYFEDYKTFEVWVNQINQLHTKYKNLLNIHKNIQDITLLINTELNWYILPLLPIVNIELPKEEIFYSYRSHSIKRVLQSLIESFEEKLQPHITRINRYLNANELCDIHGGQTIESKKCVECVSRSIEKFKNQYTTVLKPKIEPHYRSKMYRIDDAYTVLQLAKRSGTVFIAAHKFLWEKKQQQDSIKNEQLKRNAMNKRWETVKY